ncbi:MAG: hypothetical protein EA398_07885 [Deltaproteobacteria bacterium]|nr:MAG: hypothetical protein EA398_07885 [Deltaproteobacteria bacterium]
MALANRAAPGLHGAGIWIVLTMLLSLTVSAQVVAAAQGEEPRTTTVPLVLFALLPSVLLAGAMLSPWRRRLLATVATAAWPLLLGLAVVRLPEETYGAFLAPGPQFFFLTNVAGTLLLAGQAIRRLGDRRGTVGVRHRKPVDTPPALPRRFLLLHLARACCAMLLLASPVFTLLARLDAPAGPREVFLLLVILFLWILATAFFFLWPMLGEENERLRLDSTLEAEAGRTRRRWARVLARELR